MKIINYTLFVASNSVRKYLHKRNVDPDTAFLNDYKFMKAVFHILVNKFPWNHNCCLGHNFRLSSLDNIGPVFQIWFLRTKNDSLLRYYQSSSSCIQGFKDCQAVKDEKIRDMPRKSKWEIYGYQSPERRRSIRAQSS